MGSKNKLRRFQENQTFCNVIQPSREEVSEGFHLKGKWNTFFENQLPIVVELGCGKGEYTIDLAKQDLKKNYIGIDIKGARFWRGAKTALENEQKNVAFLRSQIELIDDLFDSNEIDGIWITFPDPQIKHKRTKHRLTHPDFLKKYQKILKPNGIIHLKTDSEFMFGYTFGLLQGEGHEILYAHHDIYNNLYSPKEATQIQTFYEKKYIEKSKPITYLKFKLNH